MSLPSSMTSPSGVIVPLFAISAAKTHVRMLAIDALRGFVMLLMLVDHVRETFLLHRQVTDPIDALSVTPDRKSVV